MVWSYLRLRPPASITSSRPPLAAYGPWAYSHFAYSDLLTLYRIHHLADHAFPYVHTAIEYPVLTGLFMWCAAWAPGIGGYLIASSVGLWVCALGCVVILHRLSPRYAWIFALNPLLLIYSLLNWDLLAIFFMLAGWACYRSRRYAWCGALLAMGVCAKFFPLMMLVYCILACFADRDRVVRRGGGITLAAAVLTGLVLNVPFAIVNISGWSDFFTSNVDRGGGGGLLFQLHLASHWSTGTVNAVSVVLVLATMAVLGRWVLRGAPPAVAAAAAFAVWMLLNKVFSPQYMLWVFVYGLLADWPGWTMAGVTASGLVDYANAMITLHLVSDRSRLFPWYFHTVFPLNNALRSAAITCAVLASLWVRRNDPGAAGHRIHSGVAPPRRIGAVSGLPG